MTSTTVGLAVGITIAVTAASAAGAYLYSVRQSRTLLAAARETALAQGELIRAGLEHQMMENDRSLIDRMIKTFGQQPQVESVMLLDRQGVVKYSSQPRTGGHDVFARLADLPGLPPVSAGQRGVEPRHRRRRRRRSSAR